MEEQYLILAMGWFLYFGLHSLMAAVKVKEMVYSRGISKPTYRKLYVLFSTLGLILILVYSATFNETYIIYPSRGVKIVSLVFAASGTIVINMAFKQYKLKEFIGFSVENPADELSTEGILSYVRHPIYSGIILVILGYVLYIPKLSSIITAIIIFVYLVVGIYLEEKKLMDLFGEKYRRYKKNVPALIPRFER